MPYPTTAGSAPRNAKIKIWKKERRKNRGRNHPPRPRQLMRLWGKKKKQKTEGTTKINGAGSKLSYLDHLVASYIPRGTYGAPILKPHSRKGKKNYIYGVGESGFNCWGGQRACGRVILLLSECIWNASVISLVLPAFDDNGSLGYPPRWVVYPRGFHHGWLSPVFLRGIGILS